MCTLVSMEHKEEYMEQEQSGQVTESQNVMLRSQEFNTRELTGSHWRLEKWNA